MLDLVASTRCFKEKVRNKVRVLSCFVLAQRKPEEESPKKDSDAKKTKQETSVNGSEDSAHNGKVVTAKMEPEASC